MDKIILSELAKGLNIPKHEITPQSVFYRIGGDSIAALRISAACKKQGVFASVESILRSQTISEILEAAKWLPSPGNIHIQRNNADLSHNACGRDPLTLCVGPSAAAVGQYQINGTSNIRTPIGIDLCHATDGAGISIGAQGRDTAADAHFIPPQNLTGRGSASRACEMMTLQASLVLDTRVRPGNNVISYFQEYPPSRVPALKQAWKKVIQSEPIFRSTFDNDLFWEDGIVFLSWSESTHKDERSFMKELDGIVAPRMREPTTEFQVVTLADSKSILVWHVHHALVDGYSSLLILQKVNTVLHGGEIADGVSFSELARGWRLYQSIFHQQASQFWQEYLAEMKTANSDLRLPSASHQRWPDLPLPKATTFSAPLQRILECSQAKGIPLSAIYYAAWAMTLAIYTGSDTVLFGVLFANRSLPLPGIRDVVGPMMNTLPLLLRLDRSKTTEHLVHHTMERLTQLQQFEWSFPDRYCKMTSVLAMQYDYECDGDLAPNPGASYTRLQSSIPISIFLGPKETVQINYDGNLFHAADMATLGDMYMHAIAALLEADARPLHQYFRQPLPPTMWKDIMLHGNCTSAHSRGGDADTLVSLFDASVKGYPDSVAVVKGDRGLTYAQLNEAATKVASKLCETVEPGDVICVHADRSIYWIIAICAVLKAGAVYCPLDPALPAALRDSYFKTSGSLLNPHEYQNLERLVCGEKVTIGRPVQATRIYILDDHQCPLPPGVIGELYTAGVQVSPGYINLPEETAKGFLPDTICQETNQTMYRTRDLGYWNQSGEICLLGRSDRQIKLRGFRLDLDDLEIRMARCSSATSVALALKEDILVAMLQPETTDIAAFVEAIKEALPAQALPRYVRAVTRFPLGNAGKLDYKAIAAAFSVDEPAAPSDHSSSSPSLVTERDARDIITSIWRAVLNLDDSHVLQDDSSFLELGGHSLGQMKLSTRLSAALKTRITLADVVQTGTLGDQVRRFRPPPAHVSGPQPVRGSETGGGATDMTISSTDVIKHPRPCDQASLLSAPSEAHQPIVPAAGVGSELGSNTLSPIEREWLQKYNIRKGSSSFNVNFVCALSNDLDTGRLAAAFTKVLERHSILRSIFPNEQARVYAESPPKVVLTNNIDIRQEINREFNLAEELPIRVFITPTTLVLVASHIVLDLAALNIILSEVEDCWNEKTLQTVSREYGRTVRWSRALSQEDVKFWDNLSGLHHHLEPRRLDYGGRSRVCKIPADIVRAMVQFSTRRGITLHQIALAAAALALSSHGKAASTSAVLGSPHLNRDAEDMDTVGLFLEPLVICIKEPSIEAADGTDQSSVSEDNWALAFCRGVAAASQDALSHAIPWHKLVERHAVQHKHPDVPFIQAMVTFHDNRGHEPLQINGVQPLYTWCEGSKFGLMFEFLAIREDTTILRIEHDSSIYSEANVGSIQSRVVTGLDGLVKELSKAEVERMMQDGVLRQESSSDDGGEYFGRRLVSL
ncbi:hypothetical protein MY11210_004602 [Beauveria gryllotalpidicola]